MIIGYLANWDKEKHLYPPAIQTTIAWLQQTDLAAVSPGRFEIDGDRLYAMVSEYWTEPKENRHAEAHRKYVDVQYIAEGTEIIGYSPVTADLEILEDQLGARDVIFYKNLSQEVEVTLEEGMFAVIFPWEVHRPNCRRDLSRFVRKVVMKIERNALYA